MCIRDSHLITVQNGVMIHEQLPEDPTADATVRMKRSDMLETMLAGVPLSVKKATGAIRETGKTGTYETLVSLIDPIEQNFPIVTP